MLVKKYNNLLDPKKEHPQFIFDFKDARSEFVNSEHMDVTDVSCDETDSSLGLLDNMLR